MLKVCFQSFIRSFELVFADAWQKVLLKIIFRKNFPHIGSIHCWQLAENWQAQSKPLTPELALISHLMMFFSVRVEMGPAPTQANFWPVVNKRPNRVWPGPMKFFWLEAKKIAKFGIFSGNFANPGSNPKWLTRPGSKNFDPDPSLSQGDLQVE